MSRAITDSRGNRYSAAKLGTSGSRIRGTWSATMRNRLLLTAAIACGFAAAPLIAHHSVAAQFDRTKTVTLTGPVVKLDWVNPHARFLMDVKEPDGKGTRWEIELSWPRV